MHSDRVQDFFPIQIKNGNSITSSCPSPGLPSSNSPSNFSTLLSIFHPTSTRTSTNLCASAIESLQGSQEKRVTCPTFSINPAIQSLLIPCLSTPSIFAFG